MIEVQVKTAQGSQSRFVNWPLGAKAQEPSQHEREYFVMVAVPPELDLTPRCFIVPRSHVAAAAWIEHMNWLTAPEAELGKRNAPVERARVNLQTFERYEDRWDLLFIDEHDAPVLLPREYREPAQEERIGLPPQHTWRESLPGDDPDRGDRKCYSAPAFSLYSSKSDETIWASFFIPR